ncbi:hypothetical protein DFS34DRAFT_635001 [Phlyctochytrium arcticum]|nr:hypothetical protein DFS34DRAFT_635001 [Phlyctochytrium arcticum]
MAQTTQSRTDRLRNLERERSYFTQIRKDYETVGDSEKLPRSAKTDVNSNRTVQKARQQLNDKGRLTATEIRELLDFDLQTITPDRGGLHQSSPQRRSQDSKINPEEDVCYAGTAGGLRGKIKVDSAGKHSFIEKSPKHRSVAIKDEVGQSFPQSMHRPYNEEDEEDLEKDGSGDAWKRLITKEQRARAKYYGTDKTLIVLLEEERSRFVQLETNYHKLLGEVQSLQASHMQELRNTERKHASECQVLRKEVTFRTEEAASTRHELERWQQKYRKESSVWLGTNERLEEGVHRFQKQVTEYQHRAAAQEKLYLELEAERRKVGEQLSSKEAEMRKALQMLQSIETDRAADKTRINQLEGQTTQLGRLVAQRNEEAKDLRNALQRKDSEIEDLQQTRRSYHDLRKEHEKVTAREQQHVAEIDKLNAQERSLKSDLQTLSAQQLQYSHDVERLTSIQKGYIDDIEHFKTLEQKLRHEIKEMGVRHGQQMEEISQMDAQCRKHRHDNTRLTQDLVELRTVAGDLRTQIEASAKEIQRLRANEEVLQREKEELIKQRVQATRERQAQQQEVVDLTSAMNDTKRRLEQETAEKHQMKIQNKERLLSVAEKISDLQAALSETQSQLQEFRETEASLRKAARERSDIIQNQELQIEDLQSNMSKIFTQLKADQQSHDAFKEKKKDEIIAVHEKFTAAKAAMEVEVSALRTQISQKSAQMSSMNNEISRLRIEASEATAERFRINGRISELSAAESSYQRQIKFLQATVSQKDQEISVLGIKHQSLAQQLKGLQDEINIYRTGAYGHKDDDLNRLQGNVNELNRKLKTQVDVLLNRDGSGEPGFRRISGRSSRSSSVGTGPVLHPGQSPFTSVLHSGQSPFTPTATSATANLGVSSAIANLPGAEMYPLRGRDGLGSTQTSWDPTMDRGRTRLSKQDGGQQVDYSFTVPDGPMADGYTPNMQYKS